MKKLLGTLFIFLVVLDQVTKLVIRSTFELYETRPVIDGFFNIVYVLNPGAAFGMLRNLPDGIRVGFFLIITVVAIIVVSVLLAKEVHMKFRAVGYTMILAGAVGNFIDRLVIGKVVDFLEVYYRQFVWPAFNVADSAITIGITILIIDIIFNRPQGETTE